jgi:hypothetical protein
MNTNTRKVRRVSASRSPSPIARPVHARLNRQNAFVGLDVPEIATPMNMGSVATEVNIRNNVHKSRPSSATLYTPSEPTHARNTRPQSITVVPIQSEKGHHGQLKTIHRNLEKQQGSRSLLRTRRRKSRRSRSH